MANAFFVVGVGGAGRGVCNHLKYELERRYGSATNARTRFLVIDGPDQDEAYSLPGGLQIDTAMGSSEFYRTTTNPGVAIRAIASGQAGAGEKFILPWLTPAEAARIPTEALNPLAGFGGHRTPGHAFFFLDASNLEPRLRSAYMGARQLLGGGAGAGTQVVVVLIGSLAGGTGAGMYFDVAHLLRMLAQANADPVCSFLPLPNTFDQVLTSPQQRRDLYAKYFSGLRNFGRFMRGNQQYPDIIQYTDLITVRSSTIVDVPFLIDGDHTPSKFNDVKPNIGVVPAMADFLVTLISDNLSSGAIAPQITNWAGGVLGAAEPIDKYASFGTASLQFSHSEVLETFTYRLVFQLYDDILTPIGAEVNRGQTVANQVLNSITFTQPAAAGSSNDATSQSCEPARFRDLGARMRRGDTKDRPFSRQQLEKNVQLTNWVGMARSAEDVVVDVQRASNAAQEVIRKYIEAQSDYIHGAFTSAIESAAFEFFYSQREGVREARTLAMAPNSIVHAAEMIAAIREGLGRFRAIVKRAYDQHSLPEGPSAASLMSRAQGKADDAKKKFIADKSKANAQKYLAAAQALLDIETWTKLCAGTEQLLIELGTTANELWNVVGRSSAGWVNVLSRYRELVSDRHDECLNRRRQFDEMRLRRYVPKTGGRAEDALFEKVAVAHLDNLKRQMRWRLAVDPSLSGAGRYSLVLEHPAASVSDRAAQLTVLMSYFGGEPPIQVGDYTPFAHVTWAREHLAGPLGSQTVWDVLELEYTEGWSKRKSLRTPEERTPQAYVRRLADELTNWSEQSYTFRQAPGLVRQQWTFCQEPGADHRIGLLLLQELGARQVNLIRHASFSKEVRRAQVLLKTPLAQWAHWATCQTHYLNYAQDPPILIDVYQNEQIAEELRKSIQAKVDHAFMNVIDPVLVAAMYDRTIFRYMILSLLGGVLPKRSGASPLDPQFYYLNTNAGDVELGPDWDVYGAIMRVNVPQRLTGGAWVSNNDTHESLKNLWNKLEQEMLTGAQSPAGGPGRQQAADRLQSLIDAADNWKLAPPPAGNKDLIGQTGRDQLLKIMQVISKEYVTSFKARYPVP